MNVHRGALLLMPQRRCISSFVFDIEFIIVPGGFGVLWSIAWLMIVYDTPEMDPRLSSKEKLIFLQEAYNARTNPSNTVCLPYDLLHKSMILDTKNTEIVLQN